MTDEGFRPKITDVQRPSWGRLQERFRAQDRRMGLQERDAGGPVLELRGDGDGCPAHPGEDRFDCLFCSEMS